MEKELNFNQKVEVKNIAPWDVAFRAKVKPSDVLVKANSSTFLTAEEIIAQVQNDNRLFKGVDEIGSHATLIIDNADVREYLGFDEEDRKQNVLTYEKIKEWFKIKRLDSFMATIEANVKTRAEKKFLIKAIDDLDLDSYKKIDFCHKYCRGSII